MFALAGLAGAGVAAKATARPAPKAPRPAVTEVVAPFDHVADYSECVEPLHISCAAESRSTVDGTGAAWATVSPDLVGGSGRAAGIGGHVERVRLAKAAAALRIRFEYRDVSASTEAWVQGPCAPSGGFCPRSDTAESHDLAVRAIIGGDVLHSACAACTAHVYDVIADVWVGSSEIGPKVLSSPRTVVVEVRNPDGPVPAGTLTARSLFLADIRPAQGSKQAVFASSGRATIGGTLERIMVESLIE